MAYSFLRFHCGFAACCAVYPILSVAATPSALLNPNFDGGALVQQAVPSDHKPTISAPAQPATSVLVTDVDLSQLRPSQLLQDQPLTEQLLQQALQQKQWPLLAKIIPIYAQIPTHDSILLAYAQGALWRQQGHHEQAIKAYRHIVAQQPNLLYVRFDLAAMLYENKEYTAAQDQFIKVKSANDQPNIQHLSNQYLEAIQRKMGWDIQLGMQYVKNDNVNNASSVKEFNLGPYRFTKNDDTLPKKANGISAYFSAHREFNLKGNHFATLTAQLNGTRYWDQPDYNEHTLKLEGGYKYQTIHASLAFTPFVEQNWLDDQRYGRHLGLVSEYSRWLSPRTQAIGAYTYAHKRYADAALRRYQGNLHAFSGTLAHFMSPTFMLHGGLDHQIDRLQAVDESSKKISARIGFAKELAGGISTRVNLRYGQRQFDAPHFFLNQTRKDTEYQANLALWHRALHFKGLTPKLNVRYQKIRSNLPAFYSRQNQQWYVSLEKTF